MRVRSEFQRKSDKPANRQPPPKVAMNEADIYCPQCKWRPSAEDRWECMPSCGTIWNTFWTRGVCPGCAYHWRDTQCIACGKLSPHESWYHYREPAEEHAVESGDALQA